MMLFDSEEIFKVLEEYDTDSEEKQYKIDAIYDYVENLKAEERRKLRAKQAKKEALCSVLSMIGKVIGILTMFLLLIVLPVVLITLASTGVVLEPFFSAIVGEYVLGALILIMSLPLAIYVLLKGIEND